jgi:proline iminopeptidase
LIAAGAGSVPAKAEASSSDIRMVPVRGGKYKVWTQKVGFGDLKVLTLHGGPGMNHEYLEVLTSYLPKNGFELYYYDQLGCGQSDRPLNDRLWTLPGYLDELEQVRQALGLNQFVLYGHSWGGILALEYALQYQQHLRGLVISNMAAGMKSYMRRIAWWKEQLPLAIRKHVDKFDAMRDYSSPAYERLMMTEIYPRMICRLKPWPEPVVRSFGHINEQIYNQMQGKSEFLMTGNLKEWERWDSLGQINVKTLTIGSRYDEMDPNDMKRMAQLLPNARFAYCPNGSHLCMWDDQAIYSQHLLSFLRSV